MRRREFITLVGGMAAAWPLAARPQQPAMPVVGFLRTSLPDTRLAAAFRDSLSEAGYTEGQNVALEYRWAENQLDRLADLAGDLVRRQVAVIFAAGNSAATAASAATATIPIVAVIGDDPIERGLVKRLNQPEANVTGVSFFSGAALQGKRVELLRMLAPQAKAIALLADPNNPNTAEHAQKHGKRCTPTEFNSECSEQAAKPISRSLSPHSPESGSAPSLLPGTLSSPATSAGSLRSRSASALSHSTIS